MTLTSRQDTAVGWLQSINAMESITPRMIEVIRIVEICMAGIEAVGLKPTLWSYCAVAIVVME